jgi:hypothetical protein
MHEETSFLREASVLAAAEKFFDQVQPPREMSGLRFGLSVLSFFSWLNEPASGAFQTSATPSTEVAAV